MKYALLLATVAAIYYFLSGSAPIAPVVQTVSAAETVPLATGPRNPPTAATGAALKWPLNRTRTSLPLATTTVTLRRSCRGSCEPTTGALSRARRGYLPVTKFSNWRPRF